jgi:hypothetical protein
MAKLAGKFARFAPITGGAGLNGPYRWGGGFKRERLDTTNFESAVSASGNNIHSEGLTGILDSTFQIEGWIDDAVINTLFPEATLAADFLFRKNVALGYKNVAVDVLDFSPGTAVREVGKFICQAQANGLVSPAA